MARTNVHRCYIFYISLFCLYFAETEGFFKSLFQDLGNIYCGSLSCCKFHLNDKREVENLLKMKLDSQLYGQHLAQDIILEAIKVHTNGNPVKALGIGMHGWTGTGKNYVSRMIAESVYKAGLKSPLVNVFAGKASFPSAKEVDIYRVQLSSWIRGNVSKCPYSMFIFDECEKMPTALLDVVAPYLDHHATIEGVDYRNAIFLFLSNTGGKAIASRSLELHEEGKTREDFSIMDFHHQISLGLFKEQGGFQGGDIIRGDHIDFYIPFLPLEERHVKLCIKDEYKRRGFKQYEITDSIISAVMVHMVYGPEEHPVYSVTGCKRVQSLVTNEISMRRRQSQKEEL